MNIQIQNIQILKYLHNSQKFKYSQISTNDDVKVRVKREESKGELETKLSAVDDEERRWLTMRTMTMRMSTRMMMMVMRGRRSRGHRTSDVVSGH